MTLLILGLILFHGLHGVRILAPAWREARQAQMGENGWKGAFAILSIVAVILIIWGYGAAYADAPILWTSPAWMNHVTVLLMLPAFMLVPFNMRSGRFGKNPFLTAILIWSFAHLLANGNLVSVLTFGSFFIWAKWYILSTRKTATRNPTAPLVQDLVSMGIGAAIWAAFIFVVHEWLFGVAPLG